MRVSWIPSTGILTLVLSLISLSERYNFSTKSWNQCRIFFVLFPRLKNFRVSQKRDSKVQTREHRQCNFSDVHAVKIRQVERPWLVVLLQVGNLERSKSPRCLNICHCALFSPCSVSNVQFGERLVQPSYLWRVKMLGTELLSTSTHPELFPSWMLRIAASPACKAAHDSSSSRPV